MAKGRSSKNAASSMFTSVQEPKQDAPTKTITPEPTPTTTPATEPVQAPAEAPKTGERGKEKEKFKQISIYVTEQDIKDVKQLAINSDKPEHKDMSAIIRTLIRKYLKQEK